MDGLSLVSGMVLALSLTGQLEVTQGSLRTSGAVIWSGEEGTYILTCRHYREASAKWTAREGAVSVEGTHTLLSRNDDLALLWTRQRWTGKVHTIARKAPVTPMVFVNDHTLPKRWPFGCPLYLIPGSIELGQSGSPLLHNGELYGVCWGQCDGASAYIRHDSILGFLSEAQWSSQPVASRKPVQAQRVSHTR
jgi:hypothetical protein